MKKNTLLSIAIVICKFIRVLYVLIFLIFTGFFVHLQISPSYYDQVDFNSELNYKGFYLKGYKKANDGIFTISRYEKSKYTIGDNKVLEDSEVYTLSKLNTFSLYCNFIKFSAVLFLSFLCFSEFQKVIESVKELKTFQETNVLSFRKIGKYVLIIFIITCYSALTFQNGRISGFYFTPNLLILSLLAYIMAEIFKEGNNLEEENKLTV